MTTSAEYDTSFENKWCPGCGNFGILKAMKGALAALDIAPHEVVLFSGIGQAAKTPHFLNCNFFHGLHGRALPAATGAKIANHELTILVNSGDGDCYGEGGNHFMNAIRRNIDLTLLVHDNKIYGLTKGQASPTTDLHTVTRAQPHGVINQPFNPLTVALALNAGFVARGFAGTTDHLSSLIQQAIRYRGFSLIDILQPCVSFNRVNTYQWYNDRVYELNEQNHDPSDLQAAFKRAYEWGDTIPIGLLYQSERSSFTDQIDVLTDAALFSQHFTPAKLGGIIEGL